MTALNFPASPTAGQTFPSPPVSGMPVYTWDGEKWTTQGGAIGAGYAPIDSPLFTGDPRAPNPPETDNDNSLATTKYVTDAIDAIPPPANAAEFRANSAPTKLLSSGAVWSAAQSVTLVDASPMTINLALGFDFVWVWASPGARQMANPINGKSGQKGVIILAATGGGSITSWGSDWKFPNTGIKPVISGAADMLSYFVASDGHTMYCTFSPYMA
jgi:hypothetical protein